MSANEIAMAPGMALARMGFAAIPAVIVAAGEKAGRRFFEFFTAEIENANTREAYARDVSQFLEWCEARGLALEMLNPVAIAAYVKHIQMPEDDGGMGFSKPSTKRKLAAIRMM